MGSPIENIIRLNPTPVVIRNKAPAGYNPRLNADYRPGAEIDTWMHGHLTGIVSEGDDFKATLTIRHLPEHTKSEESRVLVADGEYGIAEIKPRRRFGQISGYTLGLKK